MAEGHPEAGEVYCEDVDGTGVAYEVARRYHESPAPIVQPQIWRSVCTPKARKGIAAHAAASGDVEGVRTALASWARTRSSGGSPSTSRRKTA